MASSSRRTHLLRTAVITGIASLGLVASGMQASQASQAADRSAAAPTSVDVAPTNEIVGASTGFSAPRDVAVDSAGNRYVTNAGTNSVTVHAKDATANAAPDRTIAGAATQLAGPIGIAVDSSGWTYVASSGNNRVLVFAPNVTGNVAPTRVITGAASGINGPRGLALTPDGSIAVANAVGPSITVHRRTAAGNTAPDRTISGGSTGLVSPFGLHVDGKGKIYVGDLTAKVFVYPANANGDQAPSRTLNGANADFNQAAGVATDSDGNVYVSSFAAPQNALLVFGPTGSQPNWRLEGPASKVTSPVGLYVSLSTHRILLTNNSPSALRTYAPIAKKITLPGKVRALKVGGKQTAKNRKVSWKKPLSDGNSPIIRYKVVVKKGATTVLVKRVTKTSTTLKRANLPRGRLVVKVSARNVKGYGKAVSKAFRVRK